MTVGESHNINRMVNGVSLSQETGFLASDHCGHCPSISSAIRLPLMNNIPRQLNSSARGRTWLCWALQVQRPKALHHLQNNKTWSSGHQTRLSLGILPIKTLKKTKGSPCSMNTAPPAALVALLACIASPSGSVPFQSSTPQLCFSPLILFLYHKHTETSERPSGGAWCCHNESCCKAEHVLIRSKVMSPGLVYHCSK